MSTKLLDNVEDIEELDGNVSDSDSIDTLELLKESADLVAIENNDYNETTTPQTIDEDNDDIESVKSSTNETSDYSKLTPLTPSKNKEEDETKPPVAAIEYKTHFSYGFDDNEEIKTDDLKHLEPKLRDAWIEMRRLDKVLKRVSDKEKRVKLETKSLIEKYRVELDLLKMTSDRKESKQEQENTDNYLALSYFDKKNEEDFDNDDGQSSSIDTGRESLTPLFKTQPDGFEQDDFNDLDKKESKKNSKRNQSIASSMSSTVADAESENLKASTSSLSKNSKLRSKSNGKASSINSINNKNGKKNEKDFIKRNIQLAQDAAGALAMTEDEKKRLDELLLDEDDKNEKELVIEYDERTGMNNQIVDYNPFDVKVSAGDGFLPTLNDQQRLNEIDSRLEVRNYSRLLTGSRNAGTTSVSTINSSMDPETFRNILSVEQKKIKLNDDFDENEFGDKFIREARISREQQSRLKLIDTQLDTLRTPSSQSGGAASAGIINDVSTQRTSSSNISLISQDQLQSLLDECSLSNKSVVSIIHNHKLGTVKEENDQSGMIDDLSTIDEFINGEEEEGDVKINENIIKSLVEQAKNEGIVPIQNESSSSAADFLNEQDTEPSFYEQAMQIIKERPPILNKEFKLDVEEEYNEDDTTTTSSSIKLPKLDDEVAASVNNKMKLRRQSENANTFTSRASSAASTIANGDELRESSITSPSQSFLPKIDSRFLPNNNNNNNTK